MRILFLDLASHSVLPYEGACIACVTEEATEAIRFIDHHIADDGLIPQFDAVLREAGWKERHLTHVACVTGPGGFTSLRMAVTFANVLADELNIPAAGVHLSDLYAARTGSFGLQASGFENTNHSTHSRLTAHGSRPSSFLWIHATKKQELFVRGFGSFEPLWPKSSLISLADLTARYPQNAPFAGELLPEQRASLGQRGIEEAPMESISDTLSGVLRHLEYTHEVILPWYGRGW